MSSYGKGVFIFTMLFLFVAACLFEQEMENSIVLFHLPSILAIVFSVAAMLIATAKLGDFKNAVKSLFLNSVVLTPQEKGRMPKLFKLLGKTIYFTAAAVIFMSFTSILVNFRETNISSDMYMGITAMLYALLINLVFIYPAISIFEPADDGK